MAAYVVRINGELNGYAVALLKIRIKNFAAAV
jgi:hypothetical protein